jgi:ATP-dependent Zn protease
MVLYYAEKIDDIVLVTEFILSSRSSSSKSYAYYNDFIISFEETLVSSIRKNKIESVVNNSLKNLIKEILEVTNKDYLTDNLVNKLRCYILETLESELEENKQWMRKK